MISSRSSDPALSVHCFQALAGMRRCTSLDGLDDIAAVAFAQFGYSSFSLARFFAASGASSTSVLAGRFDPGWSSRYVARNYAGSSMIAQRMLADDRPYSWTDVLSKNGDHRVQRRIVGEASEHGLRDGLFVPVRWTDHSYAAVVLAGWDPCLADPLQRMMAEVLAAYYHHEAKRLLPLDARLTPSLSQRQRDCLAWARHGKSSTDIADLLGISAQTVEEHIAGACRKLGVRTRVQAAVEATLLGLI